jgi:hypothetical protein
MHLYIHIHTYTCLYRYMNICMHVVCLLMAIIVLLKHDLYTASTLLKRPRTPPNMSNVDYQSGDSELIMKKTRPGGQTMEEVSSFLSRCMITWKAFWRKCYKNQAFKTIFLFQYATTGQLPCVKCTDTSICYVFFGWLAKNSSSVFQPRFMRHEHGFSPSSAINSARY